MNKELEIELTQTSPSQPNAKIPEIKKSLTLQVQNRQTLLSTVPSRRRPQSLLIYILVCVMEILTIFLSLLLILLPPSQLKWAYLSYIILTVVRSLIFLYSSLKLIGLSKDLLKLYFLMDNVLLFMIASDITYILLNYFKQIDYVDGAMASYPILYFFLCGNAKVMLVICEWQRWQVILYKTIKLIGSTYFLVYGCYVIISDKVGENQKEIFLLWVFTTCGFWGEMCFQVNTKDESDNLKAEYLLTDDQ